MIIVVVTKIVPGALKCYIVHINIGRSFTAYLPNLFVKDGLYGMAGACWRILSPLRMVDSFSCHQSIMGLYRPSFFCISLPFPFRKWAIPSSPFLDGSLYAALPFSIDGGRLYVGPKMGNRAGGCSAFKYLFQGVLGELPAELPRWLILPGRWGHIGRKYLFLLASAGRFSNFRLCCRDSFALSRLKSSLLFFHDGSCALKIPSPG